MKIFFQSFLQIGLVAVNTLLISKQLFIGVFICSSAISLLWAFNVSKIALSDLKQKLIYALGAGTGAITGLFLVKCFLWKGLEQLSLTFSQLYEDFRKVQNHLSDKPKQTKYKPINKLIIMPKISYNCC